MLDNSSCSTQTQQTCITCSDQATAVQVIDLNVKDCTALVQFEGKKQTIDISLFPDVQPGQTLLVHAGVAIANPEDPCNV